MNPQSSQVLDALARHAREQPQTFALCGPHTRLTYADTAQEVATLSKELGRYGSVLGLCCANSPAWAVVDLAAVAAGIVLVPLPDFFSSAQTTHALRDAGVDVILTDRPERFSALDGLSITVRGELNIAGQNLIALQICDPISFRSDPRVAKITYTSGTTGEPKGVCLSQSAMEAVAISLLDAIGTVGVQRHLSLLPLATLLENVGGLYVPLLAGTSAHLLPLASVGLLGSAALDAPRLLRALHTHNATSTILIPQMLQALVELCEAGEPRPRSLRFVAVGGAPVSSELLVRARRVGLPVYEGYGLSECASVVAVNSPWMNVPGSVGRPLAHVRLRFADDGEIFVAGSLFRGYLGAADVASDDFLPTGDLGFLDRTGFLHLTGRKKNMFITSFGRNVAPEWIERELTQQRVIAQAAVFGEARPWNAAIIVPRADATAIEITHAVQEANRRLPDYARVRRWLRADAPFTVDNGQLTGTGRLRRAAIADTYAATLGALYDSTYSNEEIDAWAFTTN